MTHINPSFDCSRVFQHMLENSRTCAIIIMDENGFILYSNFGIEKSYGYTPNDLVGRNFEILFTEHDRFLNKPGIELATVLQRGSAADQNYLVHKNGNHIWSNGETVYTKDEDGKIFLVKLIYDINEQKLLQKFLAASNKFSESIIETTSEPLLVLDKSYRVIRVNHAYVTTFTQEIGNIMSKSFFMIDEGAWDLPELKERLRQVLASGATIDNYEHDYYCERLGHRVINMNARPIEQEGVNEMILLALRDITDIKHREQQKDDFLSMASHELKTPITTLKAYSQLARKLSEGNPQLDRYMERIEKQINSLNDLVSDLLDVTRIHSGKLSFNIREFDMYDLLKEIVETLQVSHPSHKLIIESSAPFTIEADKDRTGQVIINFITNAIKYSPDAQIVRIRMISDVEGVTLCVEDRGIGIDKAHLEQVFERFYRVSESKQFSGLGMGLYISKQIIERQHGRIWVESEPGKGSTFCFWLPLKQQKKS